MDNQNEIEQPTTDTAVVSTTDTGVEQHIPLFQMLLVPVAKIKRPENDNRHINEDELRALANSMLKNPEWLKARPVIINLYPGREWIAIAGDKRRQAAADILQWEKIPAMFVNVSPQKEKLYNIMDNKHNGEWVPQLLRADLIDLKEDAIDMSGIGFTPIDLMNAMHGTDTATIDPKTDPNYTGTTPAKKGKCTHSLQALEDEIHKAFEELNREDVAITPWHVKDRLLTFVKGHFADKKSDNTQE